MRIGIQTKATFAAASLVAVLAFLMMSISVYHGNRALRAELNKQGEVTVSGLARNAAYAMIIRDTVALNALVRGALTEREVINVRFVDRDGEVMSAIERFPRGPDGVESPPDAEDHPTGQGADGIVTHSVNWGQLEIIHFATAVHMDSRPTDVTSEMALLGFDDPVADDNDVTGFVEVCLTTQYLEEAVQTMWDNMLAATIVAAVLAIIVTVIAVRLFISPIRDLAIATTRVAGGDYDLAVQTRRSDELGDLATAFNQMTHNLKVSREALVEKELLEELVEELKSTQQQLVQAGKMAAIGQLAAGIAHEINNPLAGIMGYSELVVDKLKRKSTVGLTPEEIPGFAQYLINIVRQTNRCKEIVQNLLKYARSSTREVMGPVDLCDVVRETAELLEHQLTINNITLTIDLSGPLPLIRAHAGKLQQVFTNLIINAMQACDGRPGSITITGRQTQEFVVLLLHDTGKGIAPEHLEKIFEPFFTTKKVGQGTGLGLSVTYGLVKGMGGDIRVESIPGQGTTFELSFKSAADDVPLPAIDEERTVKTDARSAREMIAQL